jgi:MoaA/NifB/PqqE/SkfB family radical SAM enzyme
MSVSFLRKCSIALRVTGKPGTPRFASLFVTRNCNFNCPYCKSIEQPFKNIDLAAWKKVIDKLYGFGCRLFTLTGGEPLTRVDIADIVRYIGTEKKAVCWMISNFGLMTEKKIDELADAGLQFLTCSLDSLSDMGEKSDGSVLDRLEYAKKRGIIPSTLTVITKENIGEVPAILKTVISRGIIFDLGLYQCVGGLFSPVDSGPKVTGKDDLKRLVRLLCRTKITTGFVAPSLTYLKSIEKHYEQSDWKCSDTTDKYLVINNNGSLMACQEYDTGIPVLSISSLEDTVWRNAKERTVQSCKGCYYGCYYQKNNINKTDALFDAWTMLRV